MKHKATAARIPHATGQLCREAAGLRRRARRSRPGDGPRVVLRRGRARRSSGPKRGRRDPRGRPGRLPPPAGCVRRRRDRDQPPPCFRTPPAPGKASAAGRAAPSPRADPNRPGHGLHPSRRPRRFPLRLQPNAPALARGRPLGRKGEPRPRRARRPRARPGAPHSLSGRLGTLPAPSLRFPSVQLY